MPRTTIFVAALAMVACNPADGAGPYEDPGAAEPVPVDSAIAVLHPTLGSEVHGTVQFTRSGKGLEVVTELDGLEPGTHAHHVHLYGDCSAADASSAGTHFNFRGPSEDTPEDIDRITGDLGDLLVDSSGHVEARNYLGDATLEGRFSIVGRSVIVHESGNDHTQPPIGAAGGRLACGVIGIPG